MPVRIITIRPRTTVGTVVAGTIIVAGGVALLVVGATLLLGVAAVAATVGVATLAYRRLTGRAGPGTGSPAADRALDTAARDARLGLDPRLEIQPPRDVTPRVRPPVDAEDQ